MTTEAVEAILARTAEVNAFRIEDILFTGVLAEAARVKKHNHPRNFRLGSKVGVLARAGRCVRRKKAIPSARKRLIIFRTGQGRH